VYNLSTVTNTQSHQTHIMLSKTLPPLLALSTLFAPTTAIPSRTHCLCTIHDTTTTTNPNVLLEPLPPSEDDSAILPPYTSVNPSDTCTPLGPQLENLRATHPEQYADFLSHALSTTTIAEDASATSSTFRLVLSAQPGLAAMGIILPSVPPAFSSSSHQKITCRTSPSTSAYTSSLITLFVLQVIVGFAILACIAECVTIALRRYGYMPQSNSNTRLDGILARPNLRITTAQRPGMLRSQSHGSIPARPALRLSGEEKRLLAVPAEQAVFSPGVDKKQRSYRNGTWTPRSMAGAKKEFAAYVVDDVDEDDELKRPVM
jgi:hypothetical protein